MSVPMRRQEEPFVPDSLPAVAPADPSVRSLPLRRRSVRRGQRVRFLLFASLLALAFGSVTALGVRVAALNAPQSPVLRNVSRVAPGATLRPGAFTVERNLGYVTLTGNVSNHGSRDLRDIEAVVELVDGKGQTVRVDSALLTFSRLPKGEAAPFQVEMRDTTQAAAYRVRFRQLSGNGVN